MKPNVHRSGALYTILHHYTNGSNGEFEDQTIKEESNANKPTQNTPSLLKENNPNNNNKKEKKMNEQNTKKPKKQLKHSL